MKVNIQDLAEALSQSDMHQGYIDIASGRVIFLQDDLGEEEAMNHVFDIEDDWQHYLPLPNAVDAAEGEMMQRFADNQRPEVRERLNGILQGTSPALKFRQQVKHLFLQQAWENFCLEQFKAMARDFCEENALEYEDA